MTSTFDRGMNRATDTESDQDDFGHENDIDRNYGERPARGTRPKTINLTELARGGGGGGVTSANPGGISLRPPLAKNLTNRVPGISELLEADSEVVRELGRKTTTQFNPRFLEQQRAKKEGYSNQLDEKQNYQIDRVEREKRHDERERIRDERHKREMQQRSNFHKQSAATGEEVKTTLEDLNESMVARTNQLGTMVEQLRADLLESQIEQHNLQKKLYTQTCNIESQVDRKMSWLLFAALCVVFIIAIVLFVEYILPMIRDKWFGKAVATETPTTLTTPKADEKIPTPQTVVRRPSALDTDKDLSIEI